VTTATGKGNTGYFEVFGKTSGGFKITTADSTAQTVTLQVATQTGGPGTITIPDLGGAALSILNDTTGILTHLAPLAATVGAIEVTATNGSVDIAGYPWSPAKGGTGVANNAASTITVSGAYPTTLTVTNTTGVTLPTSGTLATVNGNLGTATATTPSAGDNSTSVATTAFVTLAANAATVGSIAGADTAAAAITYTNRIGKVIYISAAAGVRTYPLPDATDAAYKGTVLDFYVVAGTNHVNLKPLSGQHIVYNGASLGTDYYWQDATSAAGDFVSVNCEGGTWVVWGKNGTWAGAASP
jgi:hypothetical protein